MSAAQPVKNARSVATPANRNERIRARESGNIGWEVPFAGQGSPWSRFVEEITDGLCYGIGLFKLQEMADVLNPLDGEIWAEGSEAVVVGTGLAGMRGRALPRRSAGATMMEEGVELNGDRTGTDEHRPKQTHTDGHGRRPTNTDVCRRARRTRTCHRRGPKGAGKWERPRRAPESAGDRSLRGTCGTTCGRRSSTVAKKKEISHREAEIQKGKYATGELHERT